MSIPPGRRKPESVAQVWAAPLTASAFAAEEMRQGEARDERFGAEFVGETARQAVAAWVMAVGGYEGALADIASEDTAYWLMNPVGKDWRVARAPKAAEQLAATNRRARRYRRQEADRVRRRAQWFAGFHAASCHRLAGAMPACTAS